VIPLITGGVVFVLVFGSALAALFIHELLPER
jgi:hypothetical protein